MFEPTIPRSLTVFVEPHERAARVEVQAIGGQDTLVVTVAPAAGGGWHVTDLTDPEPSWRATWPSAIGEAIAQASTALEDRVLRELGGPDPRAAGQLAFTTADIC